MMLKGAVFAAVLLVGFAIYSLSTRGSDVTETTVPAVEEVVETVETAPEEGIEVVAEPVVAGGATMSGGIEIYVTGAATGTITIDLFEDVAPLHAAQIMALAADGQYDGVVFHRVIDGFMAQTGDVEFGDASDDQFDMRRAGTGGSQLDDIALEATAELSFTRGMVGMARSQNPNSANSQFFIMFDDGAFLDGQYTIVGEVVVGMDVVDAIKLGMGANGAVIGEADAMDVVRVINADELSDIVDAAAL